jgi:hypothetical protein
MLAIGALSAFQYGRPEPAKASPLKAAQATAARRAPIAEVCTDMGSSSLCANRNGGGTNPGTYVIGWSAGDNNNDFAFAYLTGMCGNGKVTASPPCPFTPNGGLNARYNGKMIAAIFNLTTGLCIADSGTGSGATVLDKCPDLDGNGGADGTIFVLSQATSPTIPPPTTYVVNRYWSDQLIPGGGRGTQPRWLCTIGKGLFLIENNPTGHAGLCQWNEI